MESCYTKIYYLVTISLRHLIAMKVKQIIIIMIIIMIIIVIIIIMIITIVIIIMMNNNNCNNDNYNNNNDNDVLESTVYPFLNSVLFSCPKTGGL